MRERFSSHNVTRPAASANDGQQPLGRSGNGHQQLPSSIGNGQPSADSTGSGQQQYPVSTSNGQQHQVPSGPKAVLDGDQGTTLQQAYAAALAHSPLALNPYGGHLSGWNARALALKLPARFGGLQYWPPHGPPW